MLIKVQYANIIKKWTILYQTQNFFLRKRKNTKCNSFHQIEKDDT